MTQTALARRPAAAPENYFLRGGAIAKMATGPVAPSSQDFTDDADGYFGGRISTDVKSERRVNPRDLFFRHAISLVN